MASPEQQSGRRARIERATSESSITVDIDLDGTGATDIDTGVPFFDHMLTSFGKHGCFDLTVKATGKPIKTHFAHVITVRDGKWSRFRDFQDSAAAVEAFTPDQD